MVYLMAKLKNCISGVLKTWPPCFDVALLVQHGQYVVHPRPSLTPSCNAFLLQMT